MATIQHGDIRRLDPASIVFPESLLVEGRLDIQRKRRDGRQITTAKVVAMHSAPAIPRNCLRDARNFQSRIAFAKRWIAPWRRPGISFLQVMIRTQRT